MRRTRCRTRRAQRRCGAPRRTARSLRSSTSAPRAFAQHEPRSVGRERFAAPRRVERVGVRERLHRVPRAQIAERDERLRSAGDDDVSVAAVNRAKRFADADADDEQAVEKIQNRTAEAVRDRDLSGRRVVHSEHDRRGSNAAVSDKEISIRILDRRRAAESRAPIDASAQRLLLRSARAKRRPSRRSRRRARIASRDRTAPPGARANDFDASKSI